VAAIQKAGMILPPSAAVVGVYAKVDSDRGAWKAPAISLNAVKEPAVAIDNATQASLNIDPTTAKPVNPIPAFPGRGTPIGYIDLLLLARLNPELIGVGMTLFRPAG
tara:strand:+ start:1352 stop:1672 length:321 start_codon:yes stop_codon:yes gene_type:complete